MEYSGFYNSVGGDRRYDQEFFGKLFGSFIGNGIFPNPSTNCQIVANDDMTITVKDGLAWINGVLYYNDSDFILGIEAADTVLKRIDRIVLRNSTTSRSTRAYIKKGTFASSPVAPALQRDADMYELGIADIYIGNNAVSILQANITDLRLNSNYCGVVHGLIDQVDTETIFNQYLDKYQAVDADVAAQKAGFQAAWDAWFSGIQNVLDGDTAGNLYNLIVANAADISTNTADILVHTTNIATNTADIETIYGKISNQNKKLRMGAM
ncbi:hypothetical protein [Acetobacterium malicum]|uniref:hypothetical protein n=1 Tax=Acetobacterium malicum TaxID=52692 RepID=UPI000424ED9F|nr:hypothetical protein [Acetobacterium dehalogenans]